MAVPIARIPDIRNKSQISSLPDKNTRAITNVTVAIIESDNMICLFLLYRSAQTPANGERKKVGRKPHMIATVIMEPDFVFSVMYHMIAYCTRDEPKSDMHWLPRNRMALLFQFFS